VLRPTLERSRAGRDSAPLIFALRDLFAKAFQRWGMMPKVVKGFAGFAVLPGSRLLLLPGIPWVAAPTQEFSTYDWKYGLEENVTEYMRVAWQKEGQRIANDPQLRQSFLSILTTLAARGSHARSPSAIVLLRPIILERASIDGDPRILLRS